MRSGPADHLRRVVRVWSSGAGARAPLDQTRTTRGVLDLDARQDSEAALDPGPPQDPGPRRGAVSLRVRLTLLSAALLAVALSIGVLTLTWLVANSRTDAADEAVRSRAVLLAALARSDRVPTVIPVAEPGEVAQLLATDGSVLATSASASRTLPLVPLDVVHHLLPTMPSADEAATSDVVASGTTTHSAYDDQARVALVPTVWQGQEVIAAASVPLREVQGVVGSLSWSLLAVVPLVTALLAGGTWLVVGRALQPVERMRQAAAQIAGGPGTLPVPRERELAALATTLNDMLDRLRSVADRQRELAEQQSRLAEEQGQLAARQRAFVADAAHELRSPVAALRAQLEVAQAYPDAYSAAELAAEASEEAGRLGVLVDDLLVLARVGARPVELQAVDLAAVARDVVARGGYGSVPDGDAHGTSRGDTPGEVAPPPFGVRIEVRGAGTGFADPAALARVLRNLVENAERHAAASVVVTVSPSRIVVDDDGPGIPEADRERVFERFTRLDESRERGVGGTGLGLAIARETAREGGGDVVLGEAPSGGLRATVTTATGPA